MKIFLLSIFCALAGYAAGGAIGWPGAVALSGPALKTFVPGHTKTTAYSTTQYINSLPSSYSFGGHPQFSYPQLDSFATFPAGYYPIESPSYIPATSVIYPAHPSLVPAFEPASIPGSSIIPGFPGAPSFPGFPAPITPSDPAESSNVQSPPQAGDEDSAVIESAANFDQGNIFSRYQPSQQNQPAAPQFPSSNTLLNLQSNLEQQIPQGPTPAFPQQPQIPQNRPNIAHNHEQSFPQPNLKPSIPFSPPSPNTQASTPNFPQFPQTSQKPQAPEPSQQPHVPQSSQDQKPSIPHAPQISQTPQNLFPQLPQIPQNTQGTAPSYPQQQIHPQFPHDSNPSFPQLPQNPQGPTHFYPQIGQIPQGPTQVPPQSGQIFPQFPQLTQDFGQISEGPSQSFPQSFPGANTDNSDLNNEDTISVESA